MTVQNFMTLARSINNTQREMQQQPLPFAFIYGKGISEQPQDLFIPPDALKITLKNFEGPLDLLLYLIRKQKLDILTFPIAQITQQYMHYIDLMSNLNMELAAEYLVMAAILAEIKSRLLLPNLTIEDDECDPRAELIRRLQVYEVIKKSAQELDELPRSDRDFHTVNVIFSEYLESQKKHADFELTSLVNALQTVMKRNEAYEHHHVQAEVLSTRERMSMIMEALQRGKITEFIEFSQLFSVEEGKAGVVVTFLALLELIRESLIECIQNQKFGLIRIRLYQGS